MSKSFCKVGQIWWVNLNPIIGSEQKGCRPVFVVKVFSSRLFLAFPLTKKKKETIWQMPFSFQNNANKVDSYLILSQGRTLDMQRLKRKMGRGKYGTLPLVIERFTALIQNKKIGDDCSSPRNR